MKFYTSIILLTFLFTSGIFAQNLSTDQAGSSITFTIKNLGTKVDGRFSDFIMEAKFNENDLSNSYFSGTVRIESIDTDIKARNKSLKGKKYFDAATYPEMSLTSIKLTKQSTDKYLFQGELTLKGKNNIIEFPISIEKTKDGIVVKGHFVINRQDFDVGKSSWVMSDDVNVSVVYKGSYE